MAARFGATIVPFGAVGEDDVGEVRLNAPILIIIYIPLIHTCYNLGRSMIS